jgi:hypothetical protein
MLSNIFDCFANSPDWNEEARSAISSSSIVRANEANHLSRSRTGAPEGSSSLQLEYVSLRELAPFVFAFDLLSISSHVNLNVSLVSLNKMAGASAVSSFSR